MMAFKRRPQLVAHVRQEVGLVLAGDFQLAALLFDLPEQERVLDRELGLARKQGEHPEDRLGELAGALASDDQHADGALVADQGDGDERAVTRAPEGLADRAIFAGEL